MEAFTDAIGLGTVGLCSRVIDVLKGQVDLVSLMLWLATVLGTSNSEDAKQFNTLLIEEGDHAVIEQVS